MKKAKCKIIVALSCLLLAVIISGCAGVSRTSGAMLKETVVIKGSKYVSARLLAQDYGLSYQWDPIAKKLILVKGAKEIRVMVGSCTALVNDSVENMGKEAKFYAGTVVIPHSFAYQKITPLFKKELLGRVAPADLTTPIRKVIIDPGHGGKDPGAIGRDGLQEKNVVLDISKRLKKRLQASGIQASLTRDTDKFISLAQRAKIANSNHADFFISVHANAAYSRWASGVEVFYLCESVDDTRRSVKAAQEYQLNLAEQYFGKNTAAIIWDLMYADNRISSIELAQLVCSSLSKSLVQRNRGGKPARFYVLKTNMPTILIEVGFISNPSEERKLRDSFYREKIAQAIADGIVHYNQNVIRRDTARY